MRARPTRLRGRDLAPLTVVAALLGALAAGCGSGSEKLSLSLSLSQQICETGRGYQESVTHSEIDAEGNRTQRRTIFGWSGIPSLPVTWSVSGGEAPYSLVIDGESGYRDARYIGASGTAPVGCADTSSGTSFPFGERLYAVDPQVDSGWKTVRAVVTDANGDTAEATVTIYLLLNMGFGNEHVLRRGETYRIDGWLVTAPQDYDVELGGIAERECPTTLPAGERCESEYGFILVGVDAGVRLYESDFTEASRWHFAAIGADASRTTAVNDALDALSGSILGPGPVAQ